MGRHGGHPGTLHAHALGLGIAVSQAGGIQDPDGGAVYRDDLLQYIPGGAGLVGDDGLLAAGQGVEQRAFAGVGLSDDGHRHAVPHQTSPAEALVQGVQRAAGLLQNGDGLFIFKGVQILVGVVAYGVKVGQQGHDPLPDGLYPAAHAALQLSHGGLCPQLGLGVDEIGHRLCFGEVQPPRQKGSLGELTGRRGDGSPGETVVQQGGHHRLGAVAVNFRQVLAGIGMGPGEAGRQAQVQGQAVLCQQAAVMQGAGPPQAHRVAGGRNKDAVQHRKGFRSRKPHDGDGAGHTAAGAGSDGACHGHPSRKSVYILSYHNLSAFGMAFAVAFCEKNVII